MMFDGVADKRRPYLERAQLFGETFTLCGKLVIAGPPALHQAPLAYLARISGPV